MKKINLDKEEQELLDAFSEARSELADEALTQHLARLVEDGKLTQEQADEYAEWWDLRPDTPTPRGGNFGPGLGFAPDRCPDGRSCGNNIGGQCRLQPDWNN